jgi:anti-sigma factor RsiW
MNNMNDEQLSDLVKTHASRHQASDHVRASIRTHIALQDAAREQPKLSEAKAPSRPVWWRSLWPGASVGFAFGVAMTLLLSWWVPKLLVEQSLPSELVAGYVRALRVGPLIEVASSDRHTVKPWFLGKLDFAPPVLDLAQQGFPLLGGRVEQIHGGTVAVLSYTKGKHVISVFIWPSSGVVSNQAMRRNGFNIRQWNEADMQLWAVSDMDAAEMEKFADFWRGNKDS